MVKLYYAKNLKIFPQDLTLKFIHLPKIDYDDQFSVIPEKKNKLGHQTIWLEEEITGKSYPLTLEVSAQIPVLVANETIPRKKELESKMFTKQSFFINRDLNRYILDIREIEGTMATQVIKKGKALTYSMLKNRPDVHKGDIVGVELISGNLIVETKGIIKKDGYLGRRAEVILDRTGKKVFGEIMSANLVRVELN
jgi:flagella basal body P-ring formation protein FlgA